ncbi:hypothetical protein NX89_10275 [Neisseria meningitidis]|nr:hypothetical protein NX89_10275 [Neisseria meningitidis]
MRRNGFKNRRCFDIVSISILIFNILNRIIVCLSKKIIAFSLTGGRNPRIAKTQPENLHFFAKKKKKNKLTL